MEVFTSTALQDAEKMEHPTLSFRYGITISQKCRDKPSGFPKKVLELFSHTVFFFSVSLSCLVLISNVTYSSYSIYCVSWSIFPFSLENLALKGFRGAITVEFIAKKMKDILKIVLDFFTLNSVVLLLFFFS